jgi:uncharacterized protein YfaS (alpha-2-macroglobulin family)
VPSATLSASGSASGTITIPDDAPLGDWTLTADLGSARGSATFGVLRYRRARVQGGGHARPRGGAQR